MFVFRASCVGALVFVFLSVGLCSPAKAQLTKEHRDDFKWLDELGFPKFADRQFVKVTTRRLGFLTFDQVFERERYGFLISETDKDFLFLSVSLEKKRFKKASDSTPKLEVVDLEKFAISKYAASQVNEYHRLSKQNALDSLKPFRSHLGGIGELFTVARACAQQNKPDIASKLLSHAHQLLGKTRSSFISENSFRETLAQDFGTATVWRAFDKLRDGSVSRSEILDELKFAKKIFPLVQHVEDLGQSIAVLERMVGEDAVHNAGIFDELSKQQQIAELIYQLRDQNGIQDSSHGVCDIFSYDDQLPDPQLGNNLIAPNASSRVRIPTPAMQLVNMDLDAIPQLIKVVEDKGFTRSVQGRGFEYGNNLRVGDCAERIVSRIAAREFYSGYPGHMISDGKEGECKARIQAWWDDVKANGEKQVLIEAIEAGDETSLASAFRLVERYPKSALATIIASYRKASNNKVRWNLVAAAGKLGRSAETFLKNEIKNSSLFSVQLFAAKALLKSDPKQAIDSMAKLWKQGGEKRNEVAGEGLETRHSELLNFFLEANDQRAIQIMLDPFVKDQNDESWELFWKLGYEYGECWKSPGKEIWFGENLVFSKEVKSKLEAFLIRRLECSPLFEPFSEQPSRFLLPRQPWEGVSADAYDTLAIVLPDEYPLKRTLLVSVKEAQQMAAINYWRKKNGLKLRAKKFEPSSREFSLNEVNDRLDAIVEAADITTQKRLIAEFESLGMAAFPLLQKKIDSIPQTNPSFNKLKAVLRRMSLTISKVTIEDRSQIQSSSEAASLLLKQLDSMSSTVLSSAGLVDLIVSICDELPGNRTGAVISAKRERSNGPIRLSIRFTLRPGSVKTTTKEFFYSSFVHLGEKELLRVEDKIFDFSNKNAKLESLAVAVDKCLDSSPEKPFGIYFAFKLKHKLRLLP